MTDHDSCVSCFQATSARRRRGIAYQCSNPVWETWPTSTSRKGTSRDQNLQYTHLVLFILLFIRIFKTSLNGSLCTSVQNVEILLWILVILLFSSRILVEGKLDYGEYTDKNQVRRQATTIIAGQSATHTCSSQSNVNVYLTCLDWNDLFLPLLSRQHRLPERQRENVKDFPPGLRPTTSQLLFVFSCLFKRNIEDSECHQVKELTHTGEKGGRRHQEKPKEPRSVIRIHLLILILLFVNSQYKETVCIFFFCFCVCPSFTAENNVRWNMFSLVTVGQVVALLRANRVGADKFIIVFLYLVS